MSNIVHQHRMGKGVDLYFPVLEQIPEPCFASSLSCADNRYWERDVAAFLSPMAELGYWRAYETAIVSVLVDQDLAPKSALPAMIRACGLVTPEEHRAFEAKGAHNIDALRKAICAHLPQEYWPFVHYTATSFDVISSAEAMQLRDFSAFAIQELTDLVGLLGQKALEWRHFSQIGRTHLQHAAPIVLGFWLAEYVERLTEEIANLRTDAAGLKGKFTGFVGVYGDQSIAFEDPFATERQVLDLLCLEPARHSTQIVPHNQTNRLVQTYIAISGTLNDLANDLRLLLMPEVGELRRRLDPGETGSSVGSHKVNPSQVETVAGLNRIIAALAVASQLNLESNLQRDLRDSAGKRFIPELGGFLITEVRRTGKFIAKLEPSQDRLSDNLYLSNGQIMAPAWNTMLRKHGHPEAHESTKALAEKARDRGENFIDLAQHEYAHYWEKMTPGERRMISNPELYVGQAVQRTEMVISSCFDELGLPQPALD